MRVVLWQPVDEFMAVRMSIVSIPFHVTGLFMLICYLANRKSFTMIFDIVD